MGPSQNQISNMKNETSKERQARLSYHKQYNKSYYKKKYKKTKKQRFLENPDLAQKDKEWHKLARRRYRQDPKVKEKEKAYREANKEAISKHYSEYRANNRDKLRVKQKEYYKKKISTIENSVEEFLKYSIKALTKPARKGKKVSIDYGYILNIYNKQKGLCNITKIKMLNKLKNPRAISIDRIDSTKGYEEGNIQLVCRFANLGKQHFNQDVILELIDEIRKS